MIGKNMKLLKFIFIYLVFNILILSTSFAQTIVEIKIEGNKNVSTREIEKNISLVEGQEYDPAQASDDLSAIYDMEKFDDVSIFLEEVSTDTVRIIYQVEEKAIVSKIEYKGNKEIKSKKLKKKIESKEKDFFDDFIMQDDVKKIVDFYKEEGYAECEAEAYTTLDSEKNTITITFYVTEGNKIEIKELNLVGIVNEKYKKVRKKIKTKAGKVYKQPQLDEDLASIKQYYKNSGYLNVSVQDPLVTYDPTHKYMYITIFVSEGDRYFIEELSFTGNIQRNDKELRKALEIKKGDVYSEEELRMAMFAIQELYGEDGYIKMNIVPRYEYDDFNKKLNVEFDIFEGPKVYVRNIYVDGNYVTKDYVIEREFKIKPGEPFNLKKVRETQAEIFKLGFFSDIKIEMLPTGAPDQTDLVFIVEEQKTGMASVGAGYSSVDKLVGTVRISQDNLFGRGQKLSAMWEFGTGSTKKQNYRIDFSEPYLFNTPTPFSFSIFNLTTRKFFGDFKYVEQRRGGSTSFGRHFTDNFSAFLKYSLQDIKISDVDEEIQDEVEAGNDTTSSVTPSIVFDSRDYPFDPSKGVYFRTPLQIAGGIFGGDRDFVKWETQLTAFQKIFWRVVGVVNLVTGMVTEYADSTDVPIYERYYVGGAESIRGYDYWQVGPAEGGKYKLVGNAEIKFPIVSDKGRTLLQGAFFYDVGNAWVNSSDITLQAGTGAHDLRRGYGFGIRFKTRAFPIRLDWGYGIDKRPKEAQWYFTLGDIF
jgi:outer membrane protein insertion porin family